jgi:hypothetical protein
MLIEVTEDENVVFKLTVPAVTIVEAEIGPLTASVKSPVEANLSKVIAVTVAAEAVYE